MQARRRGAKEEKFVHADTPHTARRALFSAAGLPALAAELAPFTQEGFAAAQAAGASISFTFSLPGARPARRSSRFSKKLESAPNSAR